MIIDIFLYILAWLISVIAFILPTWTFWPEDLLEGLSYFAASLAKFNFIFPVDALFAILIFFVSFEALFFGAKLVMKIFNFIRGTGSGLDI